MANKSTDGKSSGTTPFEPMDFFNFGKGQTDAALKMQKEILGAYEQASRVWLVRVQAEVELWSQLAAKLTATRSVPEALGAYQESVAQRMQMAAEDGRKLAEDCKEILGKITQSVSKGSGLGST